MKRLQKKGKIQNAAKNTSSGTFFPPVQAKLAIGKADDTFENEADSVADKVVGSSPDKNHVQKMGLEEEQIQEKPVDAITPIQKMGSEEEKEGAVQKVEEEEAVQKAEEDEKELQTKPDGSISSGNSVETKLKKNKGTGQKMNDSTQNEMESGFGADFGKVNIHTGTEAHSMSSALRAQAFTNGSDIYFNQGKYDPNSKEGKHLLAHELTHTIQQGAVDGNIQRKLNVDEKYPTKYINEFVTDPKGEDPSKTMKNKDRLNLVKTQLGKISPDFTVKAGGSVEGNHSKKEKELAKGSKSTGACCMHVLTRATSKSNWEIIVADHLFPHTNDKEQKVLINSNLTPVAVGFHNKAGQKNVYTSNPEIVLGHELCGHAALKEIDAHAKGKRAVSNVHDSTIKIENEIAKSLGKKDDELRGLAADGPHKGESFGQSAVINFGFDKADVSKLDKPERDKLKLIADLVKVFDMFVELRGHSDNVGSEGAKQRISDRRAKNVFLFLRKLGVPLRAAVDVDDNPDIKVNRFLLKGMSDKEPVPGYDPLSEQHRLRRVDVFVSSFPAGLSEMPPGISKSKKKKLSKLDTVKEPKKVKEILDKGTPCEKLLVTKAWRK